MSLPTPAQVNAASRHLITAAGVAVTIFGLQAKGVSMESVTAVINGLGNTINTLIQLVAAVGVIYGGIQAARSASPTAQIASVQQIATNAQPASQEAKAALLDATASLPEVVGDIQVADASLVNATASAQVVSADAVRP